MPVINKELVSNQEMELVNTIKGNYERAYLNGSYLWNQHINLFQSLISKSYIDRTLHTLVHKEVCSQNGADWIEITDTDGWLEEK